MVSANNMVPANTALYFNDVLYLNIFHICSLVLNHYFLKIHCYSPNVAFTDKDHNICNPKKITLPEKCGMRFRNMSSTRLSL